MFQIFANIDVSYRKLTPFRTSPRTRIRGVGDTKTQHAGGNFFEDFERYIHEKNVSHLLSKLDRGTRCRGQLGAIGSVNTVSRRDRPFPGSNFR